MNKGLTKLKAVNKLLHEESKKRYDKNPKRCKRCGKTIPYDKRENNYCNSSCFASENNKGICRNKTYYDLLRSHQKKQHTPKGKTVVWATHCKFCGKNLKPSRNWVKFCNNTCSALYKTQEAIKTNKLTHTNKERVKK